MKIFELTKQFKFEAAHRLAHGYKGLCSNIHGHSWRGELTIECDSVDKQGLAIDFAIIKKFLNKVENYFDHGIALCYTDVPIIDLCTKHKYKCVTFSQNPTSEVIAMYIFDWAKKYFKQTSKKKPSRYIKSVTIFETCTSKCVYHE